VARGARATTEMEAVGNTLVEGQTFTARAHKLTYAEAKDLLVLEGNGSADAQLFWQQHPGGATSQVTLRRIMYWPSTNEVDMNARFIDSGNIGGGKPGGGAKNNSGYGNLFGNGNKTTKDPVGPGAHRTPRGNGTALPALRR
jgi:hypothetical protein